MFTSGGLGRVHLLSVSSLMKKPYQTFQWSADIPGVVQGSTIQVSVSVKYWWAGRNRTAVACVYRLSLRSRGPFGFQSHNESHFRIGSRTNRDSLCHSRHAIHHPAASLTRYFYTHRPNHQLIIAGCQTFYDKVAAGVEVRAIEPVWVAVAWSIHDIKI